MGRESSMRETTPVARLISAPSIRWDQVHDFLDGEGGLVWYDRVRARGISDAELLVEFAGRRCYKSWAPGLNSNVTKVREDSGAYLENILSSKHGAVLEHAQ